VFRSKFILLWRALAQALVMGPCGGLGGLEAEVSEGHPVSIGVRVLGKILSDGFRWAKSAKEIWRK
jgi:hypothetical protein